MARTVKEQEYAARRNEIIDAAQRLVYTKGYEQMAIQDILDELRISKGAFYHYFGSKLALLEALIERMQQEAEPVILPIVQDPHLPALEKLESFFDTAGRWKTARKTYILSLLRVWYADDNAIVRQKVQARMVKHFTPLLAQVIRQGIQEGVLTTTYPDHVGEIVLSLLQDLGDAFVEVLLSGAPECDDLQHAESIVAAYNDALERVLGAPGGSLNLIDAETLQEWFVSPGARQRNP
jgi:TetR/AcrR family transcriptional repressor of nem operon